VEYSNPFPVHWRHVTRQHNLELSDFTFFSFFPQKNVHGRTFGDSGVFAVMSCVQSKLQRKSEVMHNKRSRAMGAELGEEGLEGVRYWSTVGYCTSLASVAQMFGAIGFARWKFRLVFWPSSAGGYPSIRHRRNVTVLKSALGSADW